MLDRLHLCHLHLPRVHPHPRRRRLQVCQVHQDRLVNRASQSPTTSTILCKIPTRDQSLRNQKFLVGRMQLSFQSSFLNASSIFSLSPTTIRRTRPEYFSPHLSCVTPPVLGGCQNSPNLRQSSTTGKISSTSSIRCLETSIYRARLKIHS